MLRLLTDQNFNGRVLRGLRRRIANLDLVRAFDAGLAGSEDPDLLEWAAKENRIVVSTGFDIQNPQVDQPASAGPVTPNGVGFGQPTAAVPQYISAITGFLDIKTD